jgi:hypothetical protein
MRDAERLINAEGSERSFGVPLPRGRVQEETQPADLQALREEPADGLEPSTPSLP